MPLNSLEELFFSQSALSIFNKCRRRFRYRYLNGLYWPAEWGMNDEIKKDLEQGRKFHLLAERYYSKTLGESVLPTSDLLQAWLNRLKKIVSPSSVISAEQELRYQQENLKLLAKYDLLKYSPSQKKLLIFDWKTDKKSLYNKNVEDSMQSRFYLYLLYEAGYKYFDEDFNLEEFPELIYWNPRYPKEKVVINYSLADYKKDQNYFENLINEILNESKFPLTEDLNKCRFCEYRPICRGKKTEKQELLEEDLELDLNWESIEEMEF